MRNECQECETYMVDPVSMHRCEKCEIRRLRAAIKRESEKHKAWNKECDCEACQRCCDLCEIAREEP